MRSRKEIREELKAALVAICWRGWFKQDRDPATAYRTMRNDDQAIDAALASYEAQLLATAQPIATPPKPAGANGSPNGVGPTIHKRT